MTELETVRAELAELTEHIQDWEAEPEEFSAEWMTRQSYLRRQADLLHMVSVLEGTGELEVFLEGDAVQDYAVDAGFLGMFLARFQTAVSAIVHEMMGEEGTRGTFRESVMAASELQLVATGRGSFKVALEGPRDYPIQPQLGDTEVSPAPLDEALDRLMAVIEAAESDIEGVRLHEAIAGLGGHRAVKRAVELSHTLAQSGTNARFVRRKSDDLPPTETRFSVPVARRLGSALEAVETTTETETMQGRLSGVRWSAQTFDLELTDSDEIISGYVPLGLRHEVRNSFDRHVEATVRKTVTKTSVEGEETAAYSLIDLSPLGEDVRFRLPGLEEPE